MVNPKECKLYAKGGYCCIDRRTTKCKLTCNEISLCKYRLRCHVKINSNNKYDKECLSFQKKT